MPETAVRAFRESDGTVPITEWLGWLEVREPKAYAKCLARIIQLAEAGFDMRRPHADTLRDGIHELRATAGNRHYRILYFFHGKNAVVLSHGLTKEAEVPGAEIELAIERKKLVRMNPDLYTADLELRGRRKMARTTKNLAEVIRGKLADDPDLADAVNHELFNASVATAIHGARTAAGLTQKELADRVGTYQSVIARLEGADYDGHSLKILNRIAEALGQRVEIRFVEQLRGKQRKSVRKKAAAQRLN